MFKDLQQLKDLQPMFATVLTQIGRPASYLDIQKARSQDVVQYRPWPGHLLPPSGEGFVIAAAWELEVGERALWEITLALHEQTSGIKLKPQPAHVLVPPYHYVGVLGQFQADQVPALDSGEEASYFEARSDNKAGWLFSEWIEQMFATYDRARV